MREIKFRAWDKITKQYYTVKSLEYDNDGNLDEVYLAGIKISESNPIANVRRPNDVVLEQYRGNKMKQLASENLVISVLSSIRESLDIYMWNKTQENYNSPFGNTGNSFKNDVFEVNAYYWGADEKEMEKPNFKYKNIEISWYKYLGRGMYIPKLTYEELDDMLNECLDSLE